MTAQTIVLEVKQDLDRDGWQDPETGVEYYDDRVMTQWGSVRTLRVKLNEDGQPEVIDAPYVTLVRKGFPDTWTPEKRIGVSFKTNLFGATIMTLEAANAVVRYHILNNPVRWSDEDEVDDRVALAIRSFISWKREVQ